MNFDKKALELAQKHLDLGWTSAPREVLAAMLSLADPQEVVASVCAREERDGDVTEWRAIWLTASTLAYCAATANTSDWDRGSHFRSISADVTAWIVPRTAVESVGVAGVQVYSNPGADWAASVTHSVKVRGHADLLTVPLFGHGSRGREGEGGSAVVEALLASLA